MTRIPLPELGGELFLTDAGLETWLIFIHGTDLRDFSAFELVGSADGKRALEEYYVPFLEMAQDHGRGLILETPTWRASPDWGARLGYSASDLTMMNREAVTLLTELRAQAGNKHPVIISGNIGPRGDGYDPGELMTADEAEAFHAFQVGAFATTDVDVISAVTMTNTPEAIGVVRATGQTGLPCVIAFTVETDGRLPTGQMLGDAIAETDAASPTPPAYYMINCAHPDHFRAQLQAGGGWLDRLGGIRANASRCSHAELDEATELDAGNPVELAADFAELRREFPNLTVFGGCCGTDHRHISQIAQTCGQAHARVASTG